LQVVALLAFYSPQQRAQLHHGTEDARRYPHIIIHAVFNEAAMSVDTPLDYAHNTGALFLCFSH
jgi:hypothetical protein